MESYPVFYEGPEGQMQERKVFRVLEEEHPCGQYGWTTVHRETGKAVIIGMLILELTEADLRDFMLSPKDDMRNG